MGEDLMEGRCFRCNADIWVSKDSAGDITLCKDCANAYESKINTLRSIQKSIKDIEDNLHEEFGGGLRQC